MDYTERYRNLRVSGHDRDVALGILRREGAGFIHCMKALHEVDRVSVGEAKALVHSSPAWSEEREVREAFWNEVIREMEMLSDA